MAEAAGHRRALMVVLGAEQSRARERSPSKLATGVWAPGYVHYPRHMLSRVRILTITTGFLGFIGLLPATASAVVTAQPDAMQVAAAMTDGTSTQVTGASWLMRPPKGNASAVSDVPLLGMPLAGASFAVLSTGNADAISAGDQNYHASINNDGPARGGSDMDGVVLKIDLKVPAGANCLSFGFRFLSEEYPQYVGKKYNDGFIAELDKNTWTTTDSAITAPDNFAFDPTGAVVSVNATGATSVKAEDAVGTVYGGGTAMLYAATPVTAGARSLYLSIFDQGDRILDSTVMLDKLIVGTTAAGECKGGASIAPPPSITPPATPTGPATIFGKNGIVSAPSNKTCISRRNFKIRIRKRAGVTYIAAFVWLNGKRVATRRGKRITAPVDLRNLPKGKYTVKIRVVTSTGRVINGTRKYRTCAKKRTPSKKNPKL